MVQKEDLCKQAVSCKQIYEREFKNKDPFLKTKEPNTGSDSDETIEMTEQEIDQAYNAVSSTLRTVSQLPCLMRTSDVTAGFCFPNPNTNACLVFYTFLYR